MTADRPYWPHSNPEPPPAEEEQVNQCGNEACWTPGEDGQPVRTEATRTFCDDCERRVAAVLRDLPEWYVRLHLHLGAAGQAGEKVGGSREDPVPISLGVEALITDLEKVLPGWEDALRASWKWPAKMDPAGPRGVRFQATCRWLLHSLTPLLAFPGGKDAGSELLELGRRCRAALGQTRLVHRLQAPCPSCDLRTLERENGSDRVVCANGRCGRSWAEVEYQRLVTVLAAETRRGRKGA